MMKKIIGLIFILSVATTAFSQDMAFGRKMVDTLTSSYFWGRGYTNEGMKKAADFLQDQFKLYGLLPMQGVDYYQPFSYPVNTFPGKMEMNINGNDLIPGKDFIVSPESRGIKASGKFDQLDSIQFINRKQMVVVKLQDKLTWDISSEVAHYSLILINKKTIDGQPKTFTVNIENELINDFKTGNICGFVKGTSKPDSIILITAHYDHLGGMGKEAFFPGANDNASGVALLLNLAHYYTKHPQKYSIGFICFAGEEAGLIGSKYFTENPLLLLKNIRFLINTDLAGTGEEGITVVNATEYPKEFDMLKAANEECKLDGSKMLTAINSRGKAANSDHYFFTEKGVPSFFFYTLGGITAYHDVFDKAATLPLTKHEALFKLLVSFNHKLMGN